MKRKNKYGDKRDIESENKPTTPSAPLHEELSPVTSAEDPTAEPPKSVAKPAEEEKTNEAEALEPSMVDEALEATLKLMEPQSDEPEEPQLPREKAVTEFHFPDLNGPEPLEKLGAALKARREELGISFAEITKNTCLAQSSILALESQPLDKLDAPFYIKNRLALYASVLNIDSQAIEDFFQNAIASKDNNTKPKQERSSAIWGLIIGGVVVLALIVALFLIQ